MTAQPRINAPNDDAISIEPFLRALRSAPNDADFVQRLQRAILAGYRALLAEIVIDMAINDGCDHLRLASGLDRTDAHRFYERHGLARTSIQFARPLIGDT